ncbi:CLUMA_CG001237, isoform A [Clunio marinus]|uniref:CLUMA_CG001237, isoform A n=1 Tax=Clunio marinus TaxID=568069 RepID=A0A1J1HJ45_9DIPT|nr:CLUMA_CG001237, isoform A [Clunio marinus]
MSLQNPTNKKILFKIKTTAPKKYCVRPNCGAIDPGQTVDIAICLQPFVFDPNEKNRHKFMVQSLMAPDGEINVDQLWKDVSPEQLMDAKLRCTFEMPEENIKEGNVSQLTSHLLKNEAMMSDAQQNVSGDGVGGKSNDSDIVRAAAEVRELREENSKMRQENLKLNEQILRLKSLVESNKSLDSSSTSAPSAKLISNPYSPPQLGQQQQIPIMWVVAAIGMAIFGLILGKFVL